MCSSNCNVNSYILDQTIPYKSSSLYDILNPIPKQDDPQNPPFYFPSPHIHYEDDHIFLQHLREILLHQPQNPSPDQPPENMEDSDKIEAGNQLHGGAIQQAPKRRFSKKDRHSKIETAQGPRDRRMRLSLDVAREFFDLQDMLGFDKASKTVEWLLIKSKAAIKELTRTKQSCSLGAVSASSTSECEVVSGIDEADVSGIRRGRTSSPKPQKSSSGKRTRAPRKPAFCPRDRESREKARERARERTKEKKRKVDESKLPNWDAMNHDMDRLGSRSSPFEESGTGGHNFDPHLEVLADVEELSSSMIFNYDNNNSGMSQGHQFMNFQAYGKSWEAYNM